VAFSSTVTLELLFVSKAEEKTPASKAPLTPSKLENRSATARQQTLEE
jgi:hypothetical protein